MNQFTTNPKTLANALAALRKTAHSGRTRGGNVHPTECVLIDVTGGTVALSTSSDQVHSVALLPCRSVSDFRAAVKVADLAKCVKASGGDITVSESGYVITVSQGMPSVTLSGIDPEDMPTQHVIPSDVPLDPVPLGTMAEAEGFRAAFDVVKSAMSECDYRPVITGACFESGDGGVIVTTDTHRLHIAGDVGHELNAVVPRQALEAIYAALGKSGHLECQSSEPVKGHDDRLNSEYSRFDIDAGDWIMTVSAHNHTATFPNWRRVVPSEHTRVFTFDRDQAAKANAAVFPVAKTVANRVRVSVHADAGLAEVCAKGDDHQNAMALMEVKASRAPGLDGSAEDFDFALNSRYLSDALASLGTDDITLWATEASRPMLFMSPSTPNRALVMPMAFA